MRGPTRILSISLLVCVTLLFILSRSASVETVSNTIKVRFPKIHQQWLQAQAQAQTRLGISSWSSSYTGPTNSDMRPQGAAVDKNKDKQVKVTNDGSTSKHDANNGKDREAFRGFTDAEQAEARARLEAGYGKAAKEDLAQDTDVVKAALDGLPQKVSTTDSSWESEPSEVLDREKAKAQSILEGMFGAETEAPKAEKPEPTEEVGWRTTGINTALANRTHTPAAFITSDPSTSPVLVAGGMDEIPSTLTTRVHATQPADVPEEYAAGHKDA